MGIYAGVNGVRRKISQPYVGVNGARRTISRGFNGRYGTRYQFFGPLEDVVAVEIQFYSVVTYDLDSSGALSGTGNVSTSLADANRYGSFSISGGTVYFSGNVNGKATLLYAEVYAVFADGHKAQADWISENYAEYGAAISWTISYYLSVTSSDGGYCRASQWHSCCGTNIGYGYYEDSKSGTTTLTSLTNYTVEIGGGMFVGSGRSGVQLSFSNVTIDGKSVPVQISSRLT